MEETEREISSLWTTLFWISVSVVLLAVHIFTGHLEIEKLKSEIVELKKGK